MISIFESKLEGLSQIKRANKQINIRIERENGFCMKRQRERVGGGGVHELAFSASTKYHLSGIRY